MSAATLHQESNCIPLIKNQTVYPSASFILAESGFLNSQEAYRLKNMARIRNRVAHTYRRLDPEELKAYGSEAALSKDLALKLIEEARKRSVDPPKPSRL
ncbi:MAG: HepT-like ribonuclease domain-containing protein [Candidatus Bathyarchaeia archaeon]